MYASLDDMIDRFGETELRQLTDRSTPPAGAINAAIVQAALDDAAALINSYVAKTAALPLASPPAILKRYAADIARYYLHGKRAEKDDAVTRAYEQAAVWLRDVSRGLVLLTDGATGIAPVEAGSVDIQGPARVMSREKLAGY
jgi:phage gp36-like protein